MNISKIPFVVRCIQKVVGNLLAYIIYQSSHSVLRVAISYLSFLCEIIMTTLRQTKFAMFLFILMAHTDDTNTETFQIENGPKYSL